MHTSRFLSFSFTGVYPGFIPWWGVENHGAAQGGGVHTDLIPFTFIRYGSGTWCVCGGELEAPTIDTPLLLHSFYLKCIRWIFMLHLPHNTIILILFGHCMFLNVPSCSHTLWQLARLATRKFPGGLMACPLHGLTEPRVKGRFENGLENS